VVASSANATRASGDVVAISARAFERDHYLAALLAPAAVRLDLIALAAFAGETGRIAGYVSEPMLGEIRLQWWRDAVDGFAAGCGSIGHPVADALGDTVRRHGLSPAHLHGMIDAHAARLVDAPFADTAALSDNFAACEGAYFTLAHHIATGRRDGLTADAFRDAGCAYGLARLLIELPATLAQGRWLLPLDLSHAHGVSIEALGPGHTPSGFVNLINALSDTSRTSALRVRAQVGSGHGRLSPALLPLALVRPYLSVSQRVGLRPFEVHDVMPLRRIWAIWQAHLTGRI
jgi:15-cis-phytoene synthase